jgi:hypothetical protein
VSAFEVYKERWRITEWRDNSVYKTEYVDEGWYDEDEVLANKPRKTNIMFIVSDTMDPLVHIRNKRSG